MGLYNPRTPSSCEPDFILSLAEARVLVRSGEATWINNYRSVRLVHLILALRGQSCHPGKLILQFVAGEFHAIRAIESWKPTFPPPLPIVVVDAERIQGPYSTWQEAAPMAAD